MEDKIIESKIDKIINSETKEPNSLLQFIREEVRALNYYLNRGALNFDVIGVMLDGINNAYNEFKEMVNLVADEMSKEDK